MIPLTPERERAITEVLRSGGVSDKEIIAYVRGKTHKKNLSWQPVFDKFNTLFNDQGGHATRDQLDDLLKQVKPDLSGDSLRTTRSRAIKALRKEVPDMVTDGNNYRSPNLDPLAFLDDEPLNTAIDIESKLKELKALGSVSSYHELAEAGKKKGWRFSSKKMTKKEMIL